MRCLKCGREMEQQQVFCASCLEAMEKYPVKPGTPIQLPQNKTTEQPKKATRRKKILSPEEHVLQIKKINGWLIGVCAVLAIALALVTAAFIHELSQPEALFPGNMGRNYTTEASQP